MACVVNTAAAINAADTKVTLVICLSNMVTEAKEALGSLL